MATDSAVSTVRTLMQTFAEETGLAPGSGDPRRYLWTDAFAVCNFLELHRLTRDEGFKQLALRLIDQVHRVLGRHRPDDPRTGWISGLGDEEGSRHPTRGGLRIGKALPERRPADPFDDRLEWDRDGQYFHYLTKWMHALDRTSRSTGNLAYNAWAVELARAAHRGFVHASRPSGPKRMYWKMSIDLSYPLVPSMGQHDPLDGLITYSQLQDTPAAISQGSTRGDLGEEIAGMELICQGMSWTTDDPLGIGGLFCDAFRLAQLRVHGAFEGHGLLQSVLRASIAGLRSFLVSDPLRFPADYRLAFRELGLSIGLKAARRLKTLLEASPATPGVKSLADPLEELSIYLPLAEAIEAFWMQDSNRRSQSWKAHADINAVMLATSLAPDGFLLL